MASSGVAGAPAWTRPLRRTGAAARRLHVSIWTMSGLPARLFMAVAIFAAAVPYTGWPFPVAWFALVVSLVVVQTTWRRRAGAAPLIAGVDPFLILLSAAYALAAFYLVHGFERAAQTLGVTLFGVLMFQILAHDYAVPRRLIATLIAPVALVVLAQVGAAAMLIREGDPWKILTLVASPLIVLRTFLAIRQNLNRGLVGRREAMARLAASETRYRMLAERSPDVIVQFDASGRVEYLSPAATAYGWSTEQLLGRRVAELFDFPSTRDSAPDRLNPASDNHGLWRATTRDGAVVWFESRASAIVDQSGRVLGAMAVLRDITERLGLEDELRARRAEAEAATVAKSQFLANMSHEVRTPLTGVVGFASLLERFPDLPDEARRYARRIASSAEALLAVVNDILDFSKLEAGRLSLDPQPFEPVGLLEETADLVRDRAIAKGLSLDVALEGEFPEALTADAARLRQVLLNLLANASKFTEAGAIVVKARYDGVAQRLRVEVRDTGVGIPEALRARLFQRFSQVDASSSRAHGGAGLGLAICKAIVEAMGGAIGVSSAPGAGSTFWFEVPAPRAARDAEPASDDRDAGASLGRLTLLVVDDVPVNRELVAAILSPFDIALHHAASGREAVRTALERPFDLILMDLQMPGMDGLAAARAIRAGTVNRQTPILALSANVFEDQVAACLAAGMNDHVAKPIRPAELVAKIAAWSSPPGAADEAPAMRA